MSNNRFIIYIQTLVVVLILGISQGAYAVNDDVTKSDLTELNQLETNLRENIEQQKNIQSEIKKTQDAEEQQELHARLETLKSQEKNLEDVFNKLVFGGLNPQTLKNSSTADEDYKWQEELLVIVKPLFSELRSLTSKQREKDRLNMENLELSDKYKTLTNGLNALNKIIPLENLSPETKTRIERLQSTWTEYQMELDKQRKLVSLQLKELDSNHITLSKRITNALSAVFLGRGLVLVMAIVSATLVIAIFSVGVKRALMWAERKRGSRKKNRKVNTRARLVFIFYSMLVYISAGLVFLSVIYIQGDMVLFGLAVLLIVVALVSLRNYAPQYISELKIFLNLGAVREGERLMYRGIPWEVRRLNFYCVCVNPLLENGSLRLSLSEVAGLNSRPYNTEEDWFPTKVGDDIFLPNGNYAKVIRQTPEMVYLDYFFKEIQIPTADFFAMQIENVAAGYYTTPTFGLDFSHADLPVQEVLDAFESKIRKMLPTIGVTDQLRSFSVQVKNIIYGKAIEYSAVMELEGSTAGSIYRIGRLVNHACLEVCQEKGWKLPREQIAINEKPDIRPI